MAFWLTFGGVSGSTMSDILKKGYCQDAGSYDDDRVNAADSLQCFVEVFHEVS